MTITVIARPGAIWKDSKYPGNDGDVRNTDSCTDTCKTDGKECDGEAFKTDVTTQAQFNEASSMKCEGGYITANEDGHGGDGSVPAKMTYNAASGNFHKCYTGTTGTCSHTDRFSTRICPCKCEKGSYQPISGIAKTCTTCEVGKWQDAIGSSECKQYVCSVGTSCLFSHLLVILTSLSSPLAL